MIDRTELFFGIALMVFVVILVKVLVIPATEISNLQTEMQALQTELQKLAEQNKINNNQALLRDFDLWQNSLNSSELAEYSGIITPMESELSCLKITDALSAEFKYKYYYLVWEEYFINVNLYSKNYTCYKTETQQQVSCAVICDKNAAKEL